MIIPGMGISSTGTREGERLEYTPHPPSSPDLRSTRLLGFEDWRTVTGEIILGANGREAIYIYIYMGELSEKEGTYRRERESSFHQGPTRDKV